MERERNFLKFLLSTVAIAALPVLGYVVTYSLTPVSGQSAFYHGLQTLFIILILLAVPYVMLKIFGYATHLWDFKEKEWRLKDIPKDKDQLEHKTSRRLRTTSHK